MLLVGIKEEESKEEKIVRKAPQVINEALRVKSVPKKSKISRLTALSSNRHRRVNKDKTDMIISLYKRCRRPRTKIRHAIKPNPRLVEKTVFSQPELNIHALVSLRPIT